MDDVVWFTKLFALVPKEDGPTLRAVQTGKSTSETLLQLQAQPSLDLALILAAKNGHTDIVQGLLRQGANVCTQAHAPIRYAARTGNTDLIDVLLQAGADASACGGDALVQAARVDALGVVQKLFPLCTGPQQARAAFAARDAHAIHTLPWMTLYTATSEGEAFVLACACGNLAFAQRMYELGAVVDETWAAEALRVTAAKKLAALTPTITWLKRLLP